ncbi:MAG TPA: hypothetical protein DEA40_15290 [Parvularcula sp.]|nr:hypothetical protein [Parvularcula sp.]
MSVAPRIILSALGALAIAACASGAGPKEARVTKGAPASPGPSATAGALPDAALPKGGCGMILWTLDIERPIPVFRAVSEKGAEIVVDGKLRQLALAEADGGAGFGVYEIQKFTGDGLTVSVRVRFGLGFEGGSYLERGLLSIEKADGWKTVIPAAGIAGCRAK